MYSKLLLVLTLGIGLSCNQSEWEKSAMNSGTGKDYPAYGGNKANNRYSPLTQITAANVHDLQVAWTYFAKDTTRAASRLREIQCQPIVVDGVLYGTTAELNLFALNAATGAELWKFEPPQEGLRLHSNRGVMYWAEGENKRIFYTAGSHLYAIDAATGTVISSFGEAGRVDLHEGLGQGLNHEVNNLTVIATSPGVICGNTLVMGSTVSESGDAAPGHIRGFDVVSGKLKWVFHTIPQPGEPGYETWPKDAYQKIGGANCWGGMSADEKRGVVYFGTGSPSSDFFGGDREGQNLYANCILALDAETGKLKWHFQAIHHDLWDRDFPIPPNLATITQKGKKIDVVVQVGKDGFVYVLERDSGKSVFPIEEKEVPITGLPTEKPYPTQPHVLKPAPLSPQIMTEDDLTNISPEANEFVKKRFREFPQMQSRFQPPTEEGTLLFGYSGGAEWGGNAISPDGILYQNVNHAPWELRMMSRKTLEKNNASLSPGNMLYNRNCAACHGEDRTGKSTLIPSLVNIGKTRKAEEIATLIQTGNGRMPAFPNLSEDNRKAIADFLLNRENFQPHEILAENEDQVAEFPYLPGYVIKYWDRFVDLNGYNANKPPWGTLNAIDLNTGDYLWTVPLGEYPELTEKGIPVTGTDTYGGPVVTGSELIFIASTKDEKIRAFDTQTGKVVWEYQLPAGGFATPITYEVDGRQYIVIAAGGGRGTKPGGWYVAFALNYE
ncbi:MAG: PQQ-binding-like beta-propeller repeat protein [Bacteroidia bacterium]|nr:PQQ-binding-like beta-propeller repeat protein [Bacteroidia bacterium]